MPGIASELSCYIMPGGGEDPRNGVKQALAAEQAGFGALWLGERIDTKDFPSIIGALSQATSRTERIDTKDFPSIIGALSQATSRITLGVGVWRRTHPRFAEKAAHRNAVAHRAGQFAVWYEWAAQGQAFPIMDEAIKWRNDKAGRFDREEPVLLWAMHDPGTSCSGKTAAFRQRSTGRRLIDKTVDLVTETNFNAAVRATYLFAG